MEFSLVGPYNSLTMVDLKALDLPDLVAFFSERGEPPWRAHQVYRWIWQKGSTDPLTWTDLPRSLRERLVEEVRVSALQAEHAAASRDGTVKFVFALQDGHRVETVWIPDGDRRTVCVSSQVGCGLGCAFCATGLLGLSRNLKAHEIVDQVLQASLLMGERATNVVFMGMGEPLQNWDAVRKALVMLMRHIGLNVGARRITVSTVGIPHRIRELARFPRQIRLAFSLHSAIQEKREAIIPLARRYPLPEILDALWAYYQAQRRWITLEYIHLPGFNDGPEDVEALVRLGRKIPSKVNVIPFNPHPELPFRAPEVEETEAFVRRLRRRFPHPVTFRRPRGRDVFGACGQLALMVRQEARSP